MFGPHTTSLHGTCPIIKFLYGILCVSRYIWLADCLMINVIWTISLCAVLMDCIVCGPLQNFWPPDSWNQNKECAYLTVCEIVGEYYSTSKLYVERFFKLRETNTKLVKILIVILYYNM